MFYQEILVRADRDENQGIQSGKVQKTAFLDAVAQTVPCKTKERLEELERAVFFDCGGPVRKVNYIDIFQDDKDGNQGKFVEALRDQYLEESLEYVRELSEALVNATGLLGDGVRVDSLNINQLREAILSVDPQKSLGEVDELIARGAGVANSDEIDGMEQQDSFGPHGVWHREGSSR